MGTSHSSHTNLGTHCTSFDAGPKGSIARWGDSFEVSMGNWKESNDHTEVWGVEYKSQKTRTCGFQLKASRDNNGVHTVHFGLGDSSDNKTDFALKITRTPNRDGLRGGITGIDSRSAPMSFTRAKQDCTVETTIVSYGCSYREGLFVLEMKKKTNSENAYVVNMAHYYVTKDVALSVAAKIQRKKNSFVVELEGPLNHPSAELRKVLVKAQRTGAWSPSACSHCSVAKGNKSSNGNKNGDSNSALKAPKSHDHHSEENVGEIVKHANFFSSTVKEQYNKGLINSSGYTSGSLNNSIIFIDCNF